MAALIAVVDPFGEGRLTEAIASGALRLGFHDNWQIADLQAGGTPSRDPEQVVLPTPFQQAEELGAGAFRFIVGWNTALSLRRRSELDPLRQRLRVHDHGRLPPGGGGDGRRRRGALPRLRASDPPRPATPSTAPGRRRAMTTASPSTYAPKADTRAYAARWKAFIANLASRMPEALAIEIWNEPNARQYWGFCEVSPGRYATLVRQAQGALRSAKLANPEIAPDMAVAVAGLSPVGENTNADADIFDWRAYLAALVDAGVTDPTATPGTADDVSTVVATHPYLRPEDCANDPEVEPADAVEAQIDQARELVGDVPIWITEVGASTSGNFDGDCRAAADVADQAASSSTSS